MFVVLLCVLHTLSNILLSACNTLSCWYLAAQSATEIGYKGPVKVPYQLKSKWRCFVVDYNYIKNQWIFRSLFAAVSSSKSIAVTSDSEEDETPHPSSPKWQCTGSSATASSTTQRKYNKKLEKRVSMIRIWRKLPRCLLQSMQKIRKPESNLSRKWWCMGHKDIPKQEKSDTKDEGTCK